MVRIWLRASALTLDLAKKDKVSILLRGRLVWSDSTCYECTYPRLFVTGLAKMAGTWSGTTSKLTLDLLGGRKG